MFEDLSGAALAVAVAAVDVGDLGEAAALELAGAVERLSGWVAARQAAAVRRAVTLMPRSFDVDPGVEVAAALGGMSLRAAGERIGFAVLLGDLPAVEQALLDGTLDGARARCVVRGSAGLHPAVLADYAARVSPPRAAGLSLRALGRLVERTVIELDPHTAEVRRRAARCSRRFSFSPDGDGQATLWLCGPVERCAAAATRISDLALAARRGGDDSPIEALRFDAALTLLTSTATTPPGTAGTTATGTPHTLRTAETATANPARDADTASTAGAALAARATETGSAGAAGSAGSAGMLPAGLVAVPVRIELQVTVPYSTLRGQDDSPGSLAGVGPITADTARELAAAADIWTRIITDPATGLPCDHSRNRYRPTAADRAHVLSRDQHCRAPGCDAPADRCDLDHCTDYPHGPTCRCNLTLLCRRHHNAKTHTGWTSHLNPTTGALTMTSPHGQPHTSHPEPLPQPRTPTTPETTTTRLRALGPLTITPPAARGRVRKVSSGVWSCGTASEQPDHRATGEGT